LEKDVKTRPVSVEKVAISAMIFAQRQKDKLTELFLSISPFLLCFSCCKSIKTAAWVQVQKAVFTQGRQYQ